LEWYETVFELIDLRSFSNLWFWIALAVMWSTASHWVLGVPFDMIARARRHEGQTVEDLHDLVRINVNRLLYIAKVSGLWIVGIASFGLTGLALLGFYYGIELAQALLLLALPMTLVGALTLSTAKQIELAGLQNEALYKRLTRHRMTVQLIGMVSIFMTAMWGMWQNMQIGAI
jgi:hypothetical protein